MIQGRHSTKQPPFSIFLAMTVVIFVSTLSAADSIGFVPNYLDGTEPASAAAKGVIALSDLPQLGDPSDEPQPASTYPVRIEAPAIAMDLPVQNLDTRDIDTLYEMLANGPIRYVDSAKLGQNGNILIFGHSSGLPIVRNQMFKAFNRISELQPSDSITLTGEDGKRYLYIVRSVEMANVSTAEAIDLSPGPGRRLTLVTCDTKMGKDARFILTADFQGVV